MNPPKKIGRLSMLKYYLIFIAITLFIPVCIEFAQMVNRGSYNFIAAIDRTYKFGTIDSPEMIFSFIQLAILAASIWVFGGQAGEAIIDKKKPKFWMSFIAILKLWLVILISVILFLVATKQAQTPTHLLINTIVTVVYIYASLGVLNGFIFAYFMGKEIERKVPSAQSAA